MKSLLVATACSLVLACSFTALDANGAAIGEAAPDFTLTDSNGNTHSLADFKGKHVILEWTNFQCPFVKKHYSSGNMQSLQKKYTDQGVVWLTICSSAEGKQGYNSPQSWNQKLAEVKASPTALLIDADGAAGRSYGCLLYTSDAADE